MAAASDSYFRAQLEQRRNRLAGAVRGSAQSAQSAQFTKLLQEVDAALERLKQGAFGICDICHEDIEPEHIRLDPLARVCLAHLTPEQRTALEEDLNLARRIQQSLLPPQDLRSDGWQFHYRYEPAGAVSGDYCDVMVAGEEAGDGAGDLLFALGDVSGKGVAASMLMTQLHAMLRSLASVNLPLTRMLERANRLFCESAIAGQFATLVCGHAKRNGGIELASAGHPAALVARRGVVEQLEATGLPLGMFPGEKFDVHSARLEPGDSLVLYTDGISEAAGTSGAEYGIRRLSDVVSKSHALAPKALVGVCLNDVGRHSAEAPPADDRTIMVLQRAMAA